MGFHIPENLFFPKKQDNRISSGGGGWRQQVRRGWAKFGKRGAELGNIGGGGLYKTQHLSAVTWLLGINGAKLYLKINTPQCNHQR